MSGNLIRRLFRYQWLRFGVVGLGNTAFSYSVFAALIYLGADYKIASFASIVCGILFAHRANRRLVFDHRGGGTFVRFLIAWSLVYAIYMLLIGVLLELGISAYIAGVLVLPVTVLTSFFAQKFFVFVDRPCCNEEK